VVPPVPGLSDVAFLTNETLFALREKPSHLLVLGGGPIGLEMAQAHRRLGCTVTVIEADRALIREDPELAAVVLDRLRAEGVTILEGTKVTAVAAGAGIAATLSDGRVLTGSHLLVAAGRKVALDRLNLGAAGVAHDARGVTVNASLRSSNRRVYAVGDAAGGAQFTHLAGYHAGVVIRQMLFGFPARARMAHIPRATYTDPELAQVGLTEAEARQRHGDRLTVLRWPFHDNDRAQAEARTAGLIKVMVVRGRPVGAGIAGAQAGELIGLWALAASSGLKMGAIAGMVAPYPTLGEISKRAAGSYFSPRLFANPVVTRAVRLVQRWLP
jgi:pyruvate/2-oxoglutarate dehydrogenase complex dihydrolipoamide dehydrogenase (E3) component